MICSTTLIFIPAGLAFENLGAVWFIRKYSAFTMGNNATKGSPRLATDGLLNVAAKNPPTSIVRQFHEVHSDNVGLFSEGRVAKRLGSFCKGICFSKTSYKAGDLVIIRVHEVSSSWSGFLRVGFTSRNPASRNAANLPKYACPDLTNQAGNWAKALPETYCQYGHVIAYYFNRQGDVYISANNEEPVLFFSGVDGSERLWALIDIYGNATAIKLLRDLPHTRSGSISSVLGSVEVDSTIECPDTIPIKYYTNLSFTPLPFHHRFGRNVMLSQDRRMAYRQGHEYSNAYVFIDRSLDINEIILIQILKLDIAYQGGLTVGMTSCDPAMISRNELPEDADDLLDRSEYWVVHKDVVNRCEVGDELYFHFTEEGELKFGKNGRSISVLMHVDRSVPLWLFFDLYGSFSKIKLAGSCNSSVSRQVPRCSSLARPSIHNTQPPSPLADPLLVDIPNKSVVVDGPPLPPRPVNERSLSTSSFNEASLGAVGGREQPSEPSECIICMENPCETVIYKCGHQCLCNNCATDIQKLDPHCPVCRKPIDDIIKVFRS